MLTTFSRAAARNFPLVLQATGARLGSPGEPSPLEHSTGELSLTTHPHKAIVTLLCTTYVLVYYVHNTELRTGRWREGQAQAQGKAGRTHVLLKTHVCCRVYWFLFTFQTRTVPSLPLVAKRPFLLHHPQDITYGQYRTQARVLRTF